MSVEEAVQRAINFNASDIGPVANAFYADRSEVAAIMGPIGSGKTSVSLMKPLAIACEQQPNGSGIRYYKHIVLRDTYRNLYNTVIPSWLQWIPKDFGQWRGGGSGEPAEHRIRFKVGSDGTIVDAWFMFVAVGDQNIEDVLRGLEVSTAHMNEMDRLNPNVLPFLRGRCGRYPSKGLGKPTFKGCWGDLNAPDEDNYCVKLFIYEKPDEFAFYEQPGGREPNAENLKTCLTDIIRARLPVRKKTLCGDLSIIKSGIPAKENPSIQAIMTVFTLRKKLCSLFRGCLCIWGPTPD